MGDESIAGGELEGEVILSLSLHHELLKGLDHLCTIEQTFFTVPLFEKFLYDFFDWLLTV